MPELASCLPNNKPYSAVHVRTKAYRSRSPTSSAATAYKAKHLFLLADETTHAVVFGVEVYVYFTLAGQHVTRQVFVPKADTTGLGGRFSAAAVMSAFLEHLLEIPVSDYFADFKVPSLESGAQESSKSAAIGADPTLGPDSANMKQAEISEYSVVNDLHKLSSEFARKGNAVVAAHETTSKPVQKHLLPAYTSESTKLCMFTKAADAYLFPGSEKNKSKHVVSGKELFRWWLTVLQRVVANKGWTIKADIPGSDAQAVQRLLPAGCVVGSIYPENGDVLQTIPVFPDDPKGRFLEHLVVENRFQQMTVRQFWHELGYRQEFRLGSVVGIIGADSGNEQSVERKESEGERIERKESEGERVERKEVDGENVRDAEAKSGSGWNFGSLVSVRKYKKIRDYIKGQDYSSLEDIQEMWSRGVGELCIRQSMKVTVEPVYGTREAQIQEPRASPINVLSVEKLPAVNNITGLVKKRPAVNNITGLVRKRNK